MTFPLNLFCSALPRCIQATACFGRIQHFLLKQPSSSLPGGSQSLPQSPSNLHSTPLSHLPAPNSRQKVDLMRFENADISWSTDSSEHTLQGVTLTLRPGFTAVIGPIASGKSTLLASMIGETFLRNGSMTPPFLSGVALCSQTPWIIDDTIQRNVTGSLIFDEKWYQFCVSSCGLRNDLEGMPRGDQTVAGSNGTSLSGGQRQRVVCLPLLL